MNIDLSKELLERHYYTLGKSVTDISKIFNCSPNKINYWLHKYKINKRTISEAVYLKNNPDGDPFEVVAPKTVEEAKLYGMGIGLYWGEGNKLNKHVVKLGNSDSELLKIFIKFLITFFRVRCEDLKFHLHMYSDISLKETMKFWCDELGIEEQQFYKPTIMESRKDGTYKKKSKHGVLTVYYANTKLRNILVNLLPT